MTLGGFRAFFRTRLDSLGYREWADGFNRSNIPSTVIDRAYFIQAGRVLSRPSNQLHHSFNYPVRIYLHLKGFRDPSAAIDQGLAEAQTILDDILSPSVRLQSDGLKDVRPSSVEVFPISESNDNAVVVEIEFEGVLIFKF